MGQAVDMREPVVRGKMCPRESTTVNLWKPRGDRRGDPDLGAFLNRMEGSRKWLVLLRDVSRLRKLNLRAAGVCHPLMMGTTCPGNVILFEVKKYS